MKAIRYIPFMPQVAYRFAEVLYHLLRLREPAALETFWRESDLDALGWEALRAARRLEDGWERVLDEIDGLLLRLLDRVPLLVRRDDRAAARVATFLVPSLERLQHAAAAGVVGHRYGVAGLATVVADGAAPVARRYFAFLALAGRHPRGEWPLFASYLTPEAHHAFLGAAAEAARYYPDKGAAGELVRLFAGIRGDLHLRAFLSPRILESLFVLADPVALPLFRDLLVSGHTARDPFHCEVTRALVMVRRLTGHLEPNTKFPDPGDRRIVTVLDEAEAEFESQRDQLNPVVVI